MGEDLFLEGDPCHDLYILVTGRVKCFRVSPEGREATSLGRRAARWSPMFITYVGENS